MGIAALLGAAAFWRRHKRAQELPAAETGPDPAEELRAKLAESRAADEQVPADDQKPAVDPDASPLDSEVRRQSVHDRARASIDELS